MSNRTASLFEAVLMLLAILATFLSFFSIFSLGAFLDVSDFVSHDKTVNLLDATLLEN